MARHKQIQPQDEPECSMDISSLIDCCFLLLIYFLVATTLIRETKLDISVPGNPDSTNKAPLEPGRITVRDDGSVYWGGDMNVGGPYDPNLDSRSPSYRDERRLAQLVDQLTQLKQQADSTGTTPIVMMLAEPATPHQRIMDVMAALAEADIHTVAMNVLPKE
ncbi:MAG: biopolymer transporter ExbD [Akkermansiaceae bacterium]|nr:biopolymer transporter ExbD [Akkermansia sp.]MCD7797932.1 biopolymer transporter ExbD [Akkermansiaceae bacterium]MCD8071205.1 biopolymer transporter ExbD [Akkermansiaceae bacterium]